jgi:hypothetical protein
MHLVKPVNPGALLQLLEERAPKPAAGSSEARVIEMAAFKKTTDGSGK